MKLHTIEAGHFMLDGGAMFGVVPKSIWQKTNPANQDNMISLATRCLLIEQGKRLILIDTGMGDKQSEKFFSYYYLAHNHTLEKSINKAGFGLEDITDVFMTHLHFDHCGGSVRFNAQKNLLQPTFKNANYWSNAAHWQWATQPNAREKASFLAENFMAIKQNGQLQPISTAEDAFIEQTEVGFGVFIANGHTEKQMIPILKYKNKTLCYMADLLPTIGHIPLPYIMGYDTRPLQTLEEKSVFLEWAVQNNCYLFLEHDPSYEVISLKKTERGIQLDKTFTLEEFQQLI